jgi:hypothetical protein
MHIDDLDGKDDGTGNFTIFECEKCYGPGWATGRLPKKTPKSKKGEPMKKGFATFSILRDDDGSSTGYSVEIFNKYNNTVEQFSGGDSEFDSQVYGTGEINESRLREMAQTTAEEMLKEHNLEGEISESEDSE